MSKNLRETFVRAREFINESDIFSPLFTFSPLAIASFKAAEYFQNPYLGYAACLTTICGAVGCVDASRRMLAEPPAP